MVRSDKKEITKKQIQKVMACKTADERMKLAASEGYEITKDKADAYLAEMDDLELGRNVSSILLIGVEQAPLDESNVINMDARSVSHDYLMTCTIQFSNITGDRHIAASGFFS